MPRREYRLKLEARAAAAAAEAKEAARLEGLRNNASKARAAKLEKKLQRAADVELGLAPEPEVKKARKPYKRRTSAPSLTEHTLQGRIDLTLAKLGRTREDLQREAGVTVHTMQALTRGARGKLSPKSLLAAAAYLGVEVAWLRDGPEKGTSSPAKAPVAVAPGPAPAARSNGHTRLNGEASHAIKVDAAMRANLQSTMSSLWGLMPMDVQVMIVSKMAELLAQQAQHHGQH